MITIRLPGLLTLAIACAFTGLCQSNTPPQFNRHAAPASVYPDTFIWFTEGAVDQESYSLSYDLLAGPTNAAVVTVPDDRPPQSYALVSWRTPSHSSVGTTNTFVIRATDSNNPPLSATSVVNIVVIERPPIGSISLSNQVPVLQLNDLLANKTYQIEWTTALPTTNWTLLSQLDRIDPGPRPPIIRIADTSELTTQRFYRIIPRGWECYGYCLGP